MLQPDEIKYIEKELKTTIKSIKHSHFQYMMRSQNDYEQEEYPGWTQSWLKTRIRDLYHLMLAYLEAKQLPNFLDTFKATFKDKINDDDFILSEELTNPEGEPELAIITRFKQFLDVFKTFDYRQTREDENIKLLSILKNTDFILKNCNSDIINEADIYKQVKWVLGLFYPSCRKLNKASFIQEFKVYNPDILIPELKIAIEYKYISGKDDNIDEFIDQIRNDATNYVDDNRYEHFIAVIYFEDTSIATPESIEISWKAKRFPNNWELVIVSGSPNKSNSRTFRKAKSAATKSVAVSRDRH
jgi:hypothetical protein